MPKTVMCASAKHGTIWIRSTDQAVIADELVNGACLLSARAGKFHERWDRIRRRYKLASECLGAAKDNGAQDRWQKYLDQQMADVSSLIRDICIFLTSKCARGMYFGENPLTPGEWGFWSESELTTHK